MGRKTREKRGGAALAEFALVLPVLLIILMGIIEFGLLLYNQHIITNASREGARYGIVARAPRRTVGEIEAVVAAYCEDHLVTFGDGVPTTDVDPDPTAGSLFGDNLTVEVTFPYDFFVLPNFVASLIGGTELRAHATMKYE